MTLRQQTAWGLCWGLVACGGQDAPPPPTEAPAEASTAPPVRTAARATLDVPVDPSRSPAPFSETLQADYAPPFVPEPTAIQVFNPPGRRCLVAVQLAHPEVAHGHTDLMLSEDGGETWKTTARLHYIDGLEELFVLNSRHLYALSRHDRGQPVPQVSVSTNSGRTWASHRITTVEDTPDWFATPESGTQLHFQDPQRGVLQIKSGGVQGWISTDDGGVSWAWEGELVRWDSSIQTQERSPGTCRVILWDTMQVLERDTGEGWTEVYRWQPPQP